MIETKCTRIQNSNSVVSKHDMNILLQRLRLPKLTKCQHDKSNQVTKNCLKYVAAEIRILAKEAYL
uniref:Uncharacterized protein n=1 Tax=Arundo donax TaxID=35708 RepID=A0A0A8ZSK7_ARUDO